MNSDEDFEDVESDLDVDYDVTKLSDKEINEKLSSANISIDIYIEELAVKNAEVDYLYEEKNGRYHKSQKKIKMNSNKETSIKKFKDKEQIK